MGETNREYELLYESLKTMAGDIKDIKVAIEQTRRDTATGFVPRESLDLRMTIMQQQITALEGDLRGMQTQLEKKEQSMISSRERVWLRLGTTGSLVISGCATLVAVLEYLTTRH